MSTIEEVKESWKKDSVVIQTKLDSEIVRVPMLHSKYLEYFVFFRAKRSATVRKLNRLKFIKRRYYRGELSREELLENGWDQWQGLKPSNAEIKDLFDQDPDLNEVEGQIDYWDTAIYQVEMIMREINGRQYALKTLLDLRKFESGV